MTTTVIVKANHGWPVNVSAKDPKTGDIAWTQRVEPNTERSFAAHNCADLYIHEVQPANAAPAPVQHVGLPVAGYRPQDEGKVALVNANKQAEERVLRILDALADQPEIDKRWLAIGRSEIEKGFMAVNRSIFRPARVDLA